MNSGQGFIQVRVEGLIAGLDECQSFSGESAGSCRGKVGRIGAGVGLVVVIEEICMRVGSGDEDACSEKSDGQD